MKPQVLRDLQALEPQNRPASQPVIRHSEGDKLVRERPWDNSVTLMGTVLKGAEAFTGPVRAALTLHSSVELRGAKQEQR